MSWWWCLVHKKVEEGLGCGNTTRLGPYTSAQLAATALDRVHARETQQITRDKVEEYRRGGEKKKE